MHKTQTQTQTPIEIFKSGTHTAMSGVSVTFSDDDLKAIAASYDAQNSPAPLVVGHPQTDAPAYGWATKLTFANGKLLADANELEPQFSEMVQAGRFKKISAALFTPNAPNNPKPGQYYIKHIGFLGAAAPAVAGLKPVQFASGEQGVIEFTDWDMATNASLWRKLRDWLIGKEGVEVADNVIPAYNIDALIMSAAQAEPAPSDDTPINYAAPNSQGDQAMSEQDKARLSALEAENAALKTQNAQFAAEKLAFAEAQAKQKADTAHAEHVAFAENLVQAGKLLPINKLSTIALLDNLATQEAKLEFGEGDTKTADTPLALYKAQLESAPKLVEFGQMGANHPSAAVANFAAPAGFEVDAVGLDLHNKALAYAAANKTSYVDALRAVDA